MTDLKREEFKNEVRKIEESNGLDVGSISDNCLIGSTVNPIDKMGSCNLRIIVPIDGPIEDAVQSAFERIYL